MFSTLECGHDIELMLNNYLLSRMIIEISHIIKEFNLGFNSFSALSFCSLHVFTLQVKFKCKKIYLPLIIEFSF